VVNVFEFSDRSNCEFLDFGVVDVPIPRLSTSEMPSSRLYEEELTVRDPEWTLPDTDLVLDENDPMAFYEKYGLHAEVIGSRLVESAGVECLIEKQSPDTLR
jgi:hypothetical protein